MTPQLYNCTFVGMKYVTTNIRLPEDLWKSLKIEAAHQGKRLAEIIRTRLTLSIAMKKERKKKPKSLCGIWKGVDIPENWREEAKKSIFPPPEKFFK